MRSRSNSSSTRTGPEAKTATPGPLPGPTTRRPLALCARMAARRKQSPRAHRGTRRTAVCRRKQDRAVGALHAAAAASNPAFVEGGGAATRRSLYSPAYSASLRVEPHETPVPVELGRFGAVRHLARASGPRAGREAAHAAGVRGRFVDQRAGRSLDELRQKGGVPVRLSFAASSVLARQIEAGGRQTCSSPPTRNGWTICSTQPHPEIVAPQPGRQPAGVHSAGGQQGRNQGRAGLPAARGAARRTSLDRRSGYRAGRPLRASALISLGVWDEIEDRLVTRRQRAQRHDVRVTWRSAARHRLHHRCAARPGVRIVDTFPANTHAPITYPGAVTIGSNNYAVSFLEFLSRPESLRYLAPVRFPGARKVKNHGSALGVVMAALCGIASIPAFAEDAALAKQVEALRTSIAEQRLQLEAQAKLLEAQQAQLEALTRQLVQSKPAPRRSLPRWRSITTVPPSPPPMAIPRLPSAPMCSSTARTYGESSAGPLATDFRRGSVGNVPNRENTAARDFSDGLYFRRARFGIEGTIAGTSTIACCWSWGLGNRRPHAYQRCVDRVHRHCAVHVPAGRIRAAGQHGRRHFARRPALPGTRQRVRIVAFAGRRRRSHRSRGQGERQTLDELRWR